MVTLGRANMERHDEVDMEGSVNATRVVSELITVLRKFNTLDEQARMLAIGLFEESYPGTLGTLLTNALEHTNDAIDPRDA